MYCGQNLQACFGLSSALWSVRCNPGSAMQELSQAGAVPPLGDTVFHCNIMHSELIDTMGHPFAVDIKITYWIPKRLPKESKDTPSIQET